MTTRKKAAKHDAAARCPLGPVTDFSSPCMEYLSGPTTRGKDRERSPMIREVRRILHTHYSDPVPELLEVGKQRWSRIPDFRAEWRIAEDDANFGKLRQEKDPVQPRHFHADISIDDRSLHIDYVFLARSGPNRVVRGFVIFDCSERVAAGADGGVLGASWRHAWPLVYRVNRHKAITITGDYEAGFQTMETTGMMLWRIDS